jgi:hypothetical protein|mmetsp:Transcript_9022/g.30460  ORF Transcript_9022/g.30460 Transcript_9022/m.30460 type:complete len:104 (-) Transcript_9022:666-977(-)
MFDDRTVEAARRIVGALARTVATTMATHGTGTTMMTMVLVVRRRRVANGGIEVGVDVNDSREGEASATGLRTSLRLRRVVVVDQRRGEEMVGEGKVAERRDAG